MNYYISTLAVYFGIYIMSAWSLNLQYGYGGILNFGWIMYQAVGAYAAAVVSIGPDTAPGAYQHYILGANLPFPVPLLVAALAGALLSGAVAMAALRRIRRDYQAAVMLMLSIIAVQVISAAPGIFNGSIGLTGIPHPLFNSLGLTLPGYQWVYAAWVFALCGVCYVVVEGLARSPWGRALRSVRDHEDAAVALGINGTVMRFETFVIGGAIAGLSGGLLVEFIGAWSPSAWSYSETLVVFVAILVGGVSNNRGVIFGSLIVPVLFLQLSQFLPQIGYPGLVDGVDWIVIGLAFMLAILLLPRGVLPERRLRVSQPSAGAGTAATAPELLTPAAPVPVPTGSGAAGAVDGQAAALTSLPSLRAVDRPLAPGSHTAARNAERSGPVLSVRDLTVRYGGITAVDSVSFDVQPAEIVGLIGPNGAGKSTLLAALGGQLTPAAGSVRLNGREVRRVPAYRRARSGLARTFQMTSEFQGLTVFENLLVSGRGQNGASLARLLGRRSSNRADERAAASRAWSLLDQLDLSYAANSYGRELSGGERRLVEIMRCLMRQPAILLLDEPTVGVAPHLMPRIVADLKEISRSGVALLLAEHSLDVIAELSDRVLVMADGQVIAEGGYDDVVAQPDVREAYVG
jgi:branched-chain amino acid transport system permease protein